MEEEVNEKIVSVAISATKLTASVLVRALAKVIAEEKARAAQKARGKSLEPKSGKMTVKELTRQNAGAVNIEVDDGNVKDLERVLRKYGIDYAVKKDKTCHPPKYFVFFKARDQDAMTMAFKEFVKRTEKRQARPKFRDVLKKFQDLAKKVNDRAREKARKQERSL